MAKTINITVLDKIATYLARQGDIVCGNSDYIAHFTFDDEWADKEKTARFTWNGQFEDVPLVDDECAVPLLSGVDEVKVGVYAGELSTTTAATIGCKRSIRCEQATPTVENDQRYANEAKEAADRAEAAADLAEDEMRKIVAEVVKPFVGAAVDAAVVPAVDAAVEEATAAAAGSAEAAAGSAAASADSAAASASSAGASAGSAGASASSAAAAEASADRAEAAADNAASDAAAAAAEAAETEVAKKVSQIGLSQELGDAGTKAVSQKTITVSFANALKGSASGATVTLDDMTPLPVKVKVTVTGVSEAAVALYPYAQEEFNSNGEIITTANSDGSLTLNGTASIFGVAILHNETTLQLPKGKYTLSCSGLLDEDVRLQLDAYKDGVYVTTVYCHGDAITFDWSELDYNQYDLLLYWVKGTSFDNTVLTPTLTKHGVMAEGTAVTVKSYGTDPGVDAKTTATTVGATVELDPIAPNMTITTDTLGAVVSVEYNKDVNKVIEKIMQAIADLGGAI